MEDWDDLNSRVYNCMIKLRSLPPETRMDCQRMVKAALDLLKIADQERVQCRIRRRVTTRFVQVMEDTRTAVSNLEGHVIIATLMKV
jgi:hypothetical protein